MIKMGKLVSRVATVHVANNSLPHGRSRFWHCAAETGAGLRRDYANVRMPEMNVVCVVCVEQKVDDKNEQPNHGDDSVCECAK